MKRNALFLVCLSAPAFLIASPEGLQVIAGDVKAPVFESPSSLLIETNSNAILHWDSFHIAPTETVRFIQPNAQSAVLNRVVGFSETHIDGLLLSNGRIFLINPQGVVIGPNGKIQAAGFIASTADLLNEDFLLGKELLFQQMTQNGIIHLGKIEALDGDVFLIGRRIQNEGEIQASNGHVGLASAQEVLIQPEGKERILIKVPFSETADEEFAIEQKGLIQALSAEIKTGTRPYANAIKFTGRSETFSLTEEGGLTFLVAEEGICSFSGEIQAQEARVLGKQVALEKGAISTSSETGGGTILIGGDYQGKNPLIPNAELTTIGPEVTLEASATNRGNGGKIIVWADESASFFGKASAQGGAKGGDGGFVEVSGKRLQFEGLVNTSAPLGKAGTLLLDPIDVNISFGPDSNVTFLGSSYQYTDCFTMTNINANNLQTNLGVGNVTISTSAPNGNMCSNPGNIILSSALTWATPNTLTLQADNGIQIDGNIDASFGTLFIQSTGNTLITSGSMTIGTLMASCQGQLTVLGTDIRALNMVQLSSSYSAGISPAVQLLGAVDISNANTVTLSASAGDISCVGLNMPATGQTAPTSFTCDALNGEISFEFGTILPNAMTLNCGDNLSFDSLTLQTANLSSSVGGDFLVTNATVGCGISTLTIDGNLTISSTSGSTAQLGRSATLSAIVGGDVTVSSSSGSAILGGFNGIGVMQLNITGDMTVTATGNSAIAQVGFTGTTALDNIQITTTGDISLSALANGSVARIGNTSTDRITGNINLTTETGVIEMETNNGGLAMIGSAVSTLYIAPNNITLTSPTTINLTTHTSSDQCIIGNTGLTNPSNANVTLVSDNDFPTAPLMGTGGVITSGPGTFQFYVYPGNQLSFYTVNATQNTLPSTINGAAFPGQPSLYDNNYQQFSTYYPDGTYIGPQYMVYYKVAAPPRPGTTPVVPVNNTLLATTVTGNLLTPPDSDSPLSTENPEKESEKKKVEEAQKTPLNNDKRGGILCH